MGRFTGAFLAGCLLFLSAPIGMMIGAAMPWLDPETLGAFNFGHYAWVYLLVCVPTLFVTGAGFFAIATATRSMMWTYVGVIAFLVLYAIAAAFLSRPEFAQAVALIDPFGTGAYEQATKYWTAAERNTRLPEFAGYVLWNRVLWLGIAFALLALAWKFYARAAKGGRMATAAAHGGPESSVRDAAPPRIATAAAGSAPARAGDAGWAQLWALTRFDMVAAVRSPAFIVLLGIGFLNAIASLWFADEIYGNTIHPVTRVMIETLRGAFTFIPLVIAIYYAGELVWRDRERRVHEILDSTPAPDWAFLVPKLLAISVVLFATLAASTLAAIATQALKGHFDFETRQVPRVVRAALHRDGRAVRRARDLHADAGAQQDRRLDADDDLLREPGDARPARLRAQPVPVRGKPGHAAFGHERPGRLRGVRMVVPGVLDRGRGAARSARLCALAPRRRRPAQDPARARSGTDARHGGSDRSRRRNRDGRPRRLDLLQHERAERLPHQLDEERLTAEYEKALIGYEKVPQPRITDVTLDVALYPDEPRVVTRGSYVIENRTGRPLDEVHVSWLRPLEMKTLEVEGATLSKDHGDFDYRIYRFDRPLAPLEKRRITFETLREQQGFRNSGNEQRIVDNGTFLNNAEIAPFLGMSRNGLLQDRAKRRKYGLPPELRPALLEDESARQFNGLRRDSDWVNSDITVSTSADQIAVAPGYVESETVAGGRRTVRYRSDAPIQNFFSVQSARYEVAKDRWKNVELAIYHDPAHAYNVERMTKAMKASLDYFSTNFSPYQFRQVRILEFPAYEDFAQSFANTIPYSEGIGFIADYRDPEKIDMVTYVTAHEIGHQWWGHQVTSAEQQGGTFLIESLAQYSALMVMEQMYGPEQIRKFLKYELDKYLRRRGGEVIEELPLVRVEDQGYIHYQKGALALYLLKDQIGADKVNEALRGLLAEFAFKPAPYANSRDLMRRFREVAGPEHEQLISDLFEKITLYDVKVTEAKSSRRADGRWDVTLEVDARKLYADGKGKETEAPLDESFDVGVFTVEPGRKGYDKTSVIAVEKTQLRSGRQTVRLVADREPTVAGVDPFNKRIDRNSEDNLATIDK